MKKIVTLLLASMLCLCLAACGCDHEWKEADCENPRTCVKCGETEGEALGHEWKDADCTNPRTCIRCQITEGEALGHKPGEPVFLNEDYVQGTHTMQTKCTVCGEVLEEETVPMDSFIQDGKFLLNVPDFTERFGKIFKEMGSGDIWYTELAEGYGTAVSMIKQQDIECVLMTFITDDQQLVTEEQQEERNIVGFACSCIPEVRGVAQGDIVVSILLACDPAMDSDTRDNYLREINDQMQKNQSTKFLLKFSGMVLEAKAGVLPGATDYYLTIE